MSESRQDENNPFFSLSHTDKAKDNIATVMMGKTNKPSLSVTIKDLITDKESSYSSIRNAAKALNSDIKTIIRREGSDKPYRDRFIITINRKEGSN